MSDSRTAIINASKKLFCQKGYNATSLSEIIAASATGKGQFYHYFDSKKELCLEVIAEHVADWQQNCFEVNLKSGKEPVEALDSMLDWIYSYHEQDMIYYGCPVGNLIIELSALDEDFRQPLAQLYADWEDLIVEQLSTLTGLPQASLKAQAQQMIAKIQGAILMLKVSQDLSLLANHFKLIKSEIEKLYQEVLA